MADRVKRAGEASSQKRNLLWGWGMEPKPAKHGIQAGYPTWRLGCESRTRDGKSAGNDEVCVALEVRV